jgi:putative heme-binding domain-containing protein
MASLMQRLPLKERWDIARQLVTHAEDASDRQQPLMIWYGIEPAVAAEPLRATELIRDSKIPAVRRLVARRLSEMIEEQPAAMDALVEVLKQRADLRPDVIAGMAAGLEGFASVKKPREWNDALVEAWSGSDSGPEVGADPLFRESLRQVALVFGSGRAAGQLMDLVKNANADANARLNAFKNLTRSANPELLPVIRSQLNDRILGAPARRALAAYDDPEIPRQLVAAWPERNPELQAATVTTLTSRPAFAFALLEAVRDGRIPRAAINPFQARQIRLFGEEPLTKLLSEVWGEIRDTPEAKKAEFARWESVLRPESVAKADRAQGRAVFQTVCGACHKMFGQGGGIGPELTGSDRRNLRYLLENILDPNAVVPADFRVSSLRLKDGRTVSGVIPEQNARTITIQTPTERLTIERSQIERHEQLSQSLMPEGLLAALGEQNGLHLMAYLMGEGQVDLPK